ncbi:hypothetical protein [Plasmodium yoelii yoelii]|uniref:Uncharacterized protein n=1 Tax=Plasmodium yoelii yoelii TaxID=73239 RepID=Q7RPZ5_PLAYO|nr:hypothetical protein [Plasmodium yoelii yoelii]
MNIYFIYLYTFFIFIPFTAKVFESPTLLKCLHIFNNFEV